MKISSTSMKTGGEQREQETVVSPNEEGKKAIKEWVKWFRNELLEALAREEDVEILIGRKPINNGYRI